MANKRWCLKTYEEMRKELMRVLLEAQTAISVTILEDIRASYVHPEVSISGTDDVKIFGDIEISEYSRDFLGYCGDFWEGYSYSFLVYNSLDVLFPRLSHKTKMGVALGVSDLFIAAYESGMLSDKSPEYLDIPAGVAGSLLYLGINAAGKYLSRRFGRSETLL